MEALGAAARYAQYSFWLETSGDDLTPRPALEGTVDADVAILGAGFTGLWTAYYLLQREPSSNVVVLEKEIAGFGASGRNGGWLYPGFPLSLGELARRYGVETARAVHYAMRETVDEVERVLRAEAIDAHFQRGGVLRLARGWHQLAALEETARTLERLGISDYAEWLSSEQVRDRVRVSDAVAGLYSAHGAVIHPGRLVRGLARAVERRGATIFERSPVVDFRGGSRPWLRTPRGEVRARVLVLAGEAYLSQLRPLQRALVPIYSLIVLTEPLPPELWEEIGWNERELLSSQRLTVDYLQRTADGRIMFGGRGAPYRFGSRIADEFDRHEPTHEMLRAMCYEWFPMLRLHGVRFTHAWGGPLGVPRDWMPTMRYDPCSGIAIACGYTGQGVATANLAGRILADLITGRPSRLVELPMPKHRLRPWEPEPLRWLGIRYVQVSLERLDRRAETTGKPPSGRSLAERLAAH
ncbi:MAG: FAD-dependent oxidoreductase [Thermomicrobium sp.]|nr:FAD-dependent oxidoreductase [Thermomicrobium sp.]